MTTSSTRPTVAFAHLGCEKNRVDTEHMVGLLAEAGYGVSTDENDASVVVVNTCSFIQDAREESVRTLVGLAEQGKELIIAGCLAQHFQEELLESIPEAKAIVGTGDYQHIVDVLARVEAGERVNQVSAVPTFVGEMSTCRGSAPPIRPSPSSRWRRAATTAAPSASFPNCGGTSAAARSNRSWRKPISWRTRGCRN